MKNPDIKAFKNNIKNILIIRRNNIGDMIYAIPVFKTIRKEFPEAHITVLADSTNAGIIKGASFVDKIIIYKKGSGIRSNKYMGCWKLLRQDKIKFDFAIALKIGYSSVSSLLTLISGAKFRMGCIPEKWHPLQLCYNLPVKGWKKWKSIHQIDALSEFIKIAGIEDFVRDVTIEVNADSINRVKNFFKDNKISEENKVVVFNISNNKPENNWPVEKFRETASLLAKEYGMRCIIVSAPSDKDKALMLSGKINNAFYFDTPEIMDFAALVAESHLLICGEGGAMHVGAGVHTPTISLWGKFRPVKWMPYGEKQFVIKKDEHVSSISAEDVLGVVRKNNLLK